jgi:hypothetical protein
MSERVDRRREVVTAWLAGRASCGSEHVHSDGQRLYSYGMVLATTGADGVKVVLDCEPPTKTTAAHVSTMRQGLRATGQPYRMFPAPEHHMRCRNPCEHLKAAEASTSAP